MMYLWTVRKYNEAGIKNTQIKVLMSFLVHRHMPFHPPREEDTPHFTVLDQRVHVI